MFRNNIFKIIICNENKWNKFVLTIHFVYLFIVAATVVFSLINHFFLLIDLLIINFWVSMTAPSMIVVYELIAKRDLQSLFFIKSMVGYCSRELKKQKEEIKKNIFWIVAIIRAKCHNNEYTCKNLHWMVGMSFL